MKLKRFKLVRYLYSLRTMQRVNIAMARGAATSALRRLNPQDPRTWEFSGFSQNGEDGIIEYLARSIEFPNKYFVEVGASDGLENNTTWLALAMRYSGVMVEGDSATSEWCKYWLSPLCYAIEFRSMFLNKDNVAQLQQTLPYQNPDVFSLDIDGNDYYVVESFLKHGFRPKIAVVEYNSVFGPELSLSVKYDPHFSKREGYGSSLYFGCSIAAWKQLFARYHYEFVTVDQNGINAFFVDPQAMVGGYSRPLQCIEFQLNASHAKEYNSSWQQQLDLIKDAPLIKV